MIKTIVNLFMFLLFFSQAAFADNFDTFARQQANNVENVIAPFKDDVQALSIKAQENMEKGKSMLPPLPSTPSSMMQKPSYPNLLVFVSFSMPPNSIQQWIEQTTSAGGVVVIRGLINNSFQETTRALAPILKDNQEGGMIVDPLLFKRFKIEKVPAVVLQRKKECQENQSCPDDFDVFYGDTTLQYAIEKLSQARGEPHA